MKGNFKATEALALLSSNKVDTADGKAALKQLQHSVSEQFHEIARQERMTPRRAIMVGLGLHAIKASVKHGQFTPWMEANLTQGKIWSKGTAIKNASFYMRLAISFVEEAKPSRPELSALPAGELSIENPAGHAAKLLARMDKFVGDRSLNELLVDHGIKTGSGSGSGGRGDDADALPADDNTLLQDTAQLLLNFRQTFTNPDTLKRLSPQALDDLYAQWNDASEKFRALYSTLRGKKE